MVFNESMHYLNEQTIVLNHEIFTYLLQYSIFSPLLKCYPNEFRKGPELLENPKIKWVLQLMVRQLNDEYSQDDQ